MGTELAGLIAIPLLLLIIPTGLALIVRRLHDMGISGWNVLWLAIPFLGILVNFYFMLAEGQKDQTNTVKMN